ncbi:MAG: hypothetical protein R2710_31360 [Acidimicrobiales bacterium]
MYAECVGGGEERLGVWLAAGDGLGGDGHVRDRDTGGRPSGAGEAPAARRDDRPRTAGSEAVISTAPGSACPRCQVELELFESIDCGGESLRLEMVAQRVDRSNARKFAKEEVDLEVEFLRELSPCGLDGSVRVDQHTVAVEEDCINVDDHPNNLELGPILGWRRPASTRTFGLTSLWERRVPRPLLEEFVCPTRPPSRPPRPMPVSRCRATSTPHRWSDGPDRLP